jgi:uncharacterized protein with NRDE domain
MCLLAIAWHAHATHPLVLAANRDEFHARAAAPLAAWERPAIVAGRDLQAGGTWLAFGPAGRFGVITNFRELGRPRRSAPSRGGLIPRFLASELPAAGFLEQLEVDAMGYAGFNLLLGDGDELWYSSNRADEFARRLEPGVYGLSNHFLDTPWPKLVRVRDRLRALLDGAATGSMPTRDLHDALLDSLEDRARAELHDLPATGLTPQWEHVLSSPFVVHPEYGTRCATVALVDASGAGLVRERRYAADGSSTGETELELNGT